VIWPTRPRADRDSSLFDRPDWSEVAIDGLRTKDNEVVSVDVCTKMWMPRERKRSSLRTARRRVYRYSTSVARDDFVRSRNDNLEFKVLPVSQESWPTMREPGGSRALRL